MDLSWSELLIVGIVALIVIGPKDLPGMFREFGRFTAKIRAMGREFSRAMETAAKESGVRDVAEDLRKVANPKTMGLDAMRGAADKFEKWDPLKPATPAATPLKPPPIPPVPAPAATPAVSTATTPQGPATAALATSVAARKAAAAEKTAALRAATAAAALPPAAEAPQPKRGGRVRKKPEPVKGDDA